MIWYVQQLTGEVPKLEQYLYTIYQALGNHHISTKPRDFSGTDNVDLSLAVDGSPKRATNRIHYNIHVCLRCAGRSDDTFNDPWTMPWVRACVATIAILLVEATLRLDDLVDQILDSLLLHIYDAACLGDKRWLSLLLMQYGNSF